MDSAADSTPAPIEPANDTADETIVDVTPGDPAGPDAAEAADAKTGDDPETDSAKSA